MASRAVICLDKFRGSLTARQACAALAAGILAASPGSEVIEIPIADGGEGTIDALVQAGYQRRMVRVRGPGGEPADAGYAVATGRVVVELAQASGWSAITGTPAPLTASTFGTGEVIRAALGHERPELVLAIGGSATTDGGAGMLAALGARLLAAPEGRVTGADGGRRGLIGPGGAGLADLEWIDLGGLDQRLARTSVIVASDVTNPLLGPAGAAAIFGPQKGASPAEVEVLERGLRRFAAVMTQVIGRDYSAAPGAGAAGGTGFAALAVLGATYRSGIEFVIGESRVADAISGASLVITGEGRLDEQSLRGKAPAGVAELATAAGIPLVVVAGQVALPEERLRALGAVGAYSLTEEAGSAAAAMAAAAELLRGVGTRIAGSYLPR